MKILLFTANFRDSYIDVEREHRTLQSALTSTSDNLQVLPAAEVADLEKAIARSKKTGGIDVLHFCGHATPEEGLHLRGPARGTEFLKAEQLKAILAGAGVKLVVLNACNTQALAEALTHVVPAAIGTTRPVRDVVARQFTRNFYAALQGNSRAREAFEIALKKQKQAATPAYLYAGLDL
ncbi:MAG: CHAT domain-containing protein [Halioglobus sp.]